MRTADSSLKKASGYLNLKVVDSGGKSHSFKVGLALFNDRKLDKGFLNNPNLFNELIAKGRVTATLWVAGNDEDSEDINFD
jgi:hypothetical protein